MYSVDESDLQRDEVAIIKVFVKNIFSVTLLRINGWKNCQFGKENCSI